MERAVFLSCRRGVTLPASALNRAAVTTNVGSSALLLSLGTQPSFDFHPNGNFVAASLSNGPITLLDCSTLAPIGKPFVGHNVSPSHVLFCLGGAVLTSGGSDGRICLWASSHACA